ncbi:hypothetical protein STEG23_014633 [Scotinomys teguina]
MDCVNVPANLEGAVTATQSVMYFICTAHFQHTPNSNVNVLIEHYANEVVFHWNPDRMAFQFHWNPDRMAFQFPWNPGRMAFQFPWNPGRMAF